MQDLIIVCAGGYGRDVYDIIRSVNIDAERMGLEKPFRVLGFIDDAPDPLRGKNLDVPVLGTIRDWQPKGDEQYVMANGTPKSKEKLAELLKARGARFATIISPRTYTAIPDNVTIGEGAIIAPYAIGQNVKIGNFANVMACAVAQDSEIGDYSTIGAFANVNGIVGRRVFIGSQAVVLGGKKIGDDAFVSACSLVVNNVKPGARVFGVPAQKMDW